MQETAMRRKDLEVTDRQRIREILEEVKILHLGLVDEGEPYVVPMHFGLHMDDTSCTFYFHSAREGRKLDIMARNPRVCVEASRLCPAASGGRHGQGYQSVIATGRACLVEQLDEKIAAIGLLRRHSGKPGREITVEHASKVCIFKVEADRLACKVR